MTTTPPGPKEAFIAGALSSETTRWTTSLYDAIILDRHLPLAIALYEPSNPDTLYVIPDPNALGFVKHLPAQEIAALWALAGALPDPRRSLIEKWTDIILYQVACGRRVVALAFITGREAMIDFGPGGAPFSEDAVYRAIHEAWDQSRLPPPGSLPIT